MKKNKLFKLMTINGLSLFAFSSFALGNAYASGSKLGELGDTINNDFLKWIPVILLGVGIYMIIKRDWFKMFGFIAAATLMAVFTNWKTVTNFGNLIYNYFFV
ncbi:hypothetical protein ACFQ88_39215 [Paenibacillus sp. NPDC056579]|uniref:hypothetical protein n=1 Tax=Paenibacillus sp. NPDC056579 TaxID=3345871 RepID=UPI00369A19FE